MATLTQCKYCQRDMSSDNTYCPHCKKLVPKIVECRICKEQLSSLQAIGKTREEKTYFFCSNCNENLMKDMHCPLCKYLIPEHVQEKWADTRRKEDYNKLGSAICSNCKSEYYIQVHSYCGWWVITETTYRSESHPFCSMVINKKTALAQQEQIEWRRANAHCTECGNKLHYLEKYLGREKHGRIDYF